MSLVFSIPSFGLAQSSNHESNVPLFEFSKSETSTSKSQVAGPHLKAEVFKVVGCGGDGERVSDAGPFMWRANMGMEGDAPAEFTVHTREGAHSEKAALDTFVTRCDDLRTERDAFWSRWKQECEEVLERCVPEGLEQLRDDIFDA